MTGLRAALADYLALRRALGYKLAADERLLRQFVGFMEANDARVITTALALSWATLPSGASPGWLAHRLSAVRLFAAFAASLDEATQIPPVGCLPGRAARAVPYLYSDAEVETLMAAASWAVLDRAADPPVLSQDARIDLDLPGHIVHRGLGELPSVPGEPGLKREELQHQAERQPARSGLVGQ